MVIVVGLLNILETLQEMRLYQPRLGKNLSHVVQESKMPDTAGGTSSAYNWHGPVQHRSGKQGLDSHRAYTVLQVWVILSQPAMPNSWEADPCAFCYDHRSREYFQAGGWWQGTER